SSGSRTSASRNAASPPLPRGGSSGARRPQTTTRSPSSRKAPAIAAPIPRVPPVTRTTRPATPLTVPRAERGSTQLPSAQYPGPLRRQAAPGPRAAPEQLGRFGALEVEVGVVLPGEADAAVHLD